MYFYSRSSEWDMGVLGQLLDHNNAQPPKAVLSRRRGREACQHKKQRKLCCACNTQGLSRVVHFASGSSEF